MNPRRFEGHPLVTYPAPKPQRQPKYPLPPGCPALVSSLAKLAPWVQAAGLWATPPCRMTLHQWKRAGLIVTRKGAAGATLYDVPATLQLLNANRKIAQ